MGHKKQNIQKRQIGTLQRVLFLARLLSRDEKIVLVKDVANQLGEPLYTQADVKHIVNEALAAAERRRPLLDGVKDFAQQIASLKR